MRLTNGKSGFGGGVRNFRGGALSMFDCTITRNNFNTPEPEGVRGGGLDNQDSTTTLTRCTISFNNCISTNAGSGDGAGLCHSGDSGSLTLIDCHVTQNTGLGNGGGGIAVQAGTASLTNTFVWDNTNPQCNGNITVVGSGGCGVAPPA